MVAVPSAHTAHFPAEAKSVLVISSPMLDARTTAAILGALHARETTRIHVLAVLPRPTGYAKSFLGAIDVKDVQERRARKTLEPLRAALEAAGTPFRVHIESGLWLETICRYARELGCSRVVVGDNPHHALRRLVLRHDCWRIESFLRDAGVQCAVVHGEAQARRPAVSLGRNASHPR